MRRLLAPLGMWFGLLCLKFAGWYFLRQTIRQRVFVDGEERDVGPRWVERYIVKRDEWDRPTGIILVIRKDQTGKKFERVDLVDVKWDAGKKEWHYYRPGTYDPDPRIAHAPNQ